MNKLVLFLGSLALAGWMFYVSHQPTVIPACSCIEKKSQELLNHKQSEKLSLVLLLQMLNPR